MRRLLGDDLDPALRPILLVTLLGSVAFSSLYVFTAIWAIEELGASERQLSVAFLVGAIAGIVAGYAGGHLSDHLGRKPLILISWGGEATAGLLYLSVGDSVVLGLVVFVLVGAFGSLGGGVSQALVGDVLPAERHEHGFAAVRVVSNLGVTAGPAVGGLLLLGDRWPVLFVGASLLAGVAWLVAWRFLPSRGVHSPDEAPDRSSFRVIARDRVFLLFGLAMALAWIVYMTYETVLPISLTQSHGIDKSVWGFLLAINPALVTLFQLRLTRWTAGVPVGVKLPLAMLLMGIPFTLLSVSSGLLFVGVLLVVFVIGEMLWVPASQSVVARLAPGDLRGAYMGAFSGLASVGFAISPFIGLQTRAAFGDTAMWVLFAALGVAGALLSLAVCRVPAIAGLRGTGGDPALATGAG